MLLRQVPWLTDLVAGGCRWFAGGLLQVMKGYVSKGFIVEHHIQQQPWSALGTDGPRRGVLQDLGEGTTAGALNVSLALFDLFCAAVSEKIVEQVCIESGPQRGWWRPGWCNQWRKNTRCVWPPAGVHCEKWPFCCFVCDMSTATSDLICPRLSRHLQQEELQWDQLVVMRPLQTLAQIIASLMSGSGPLKEEAFWHLLGDEKEQLGWESAEVLTLLTWMWSYCMLRFVLHSHYKYRLFQIPTVAQPPNWFY